MRIVVLASPKNSYSGNLSFVMVNSYLSPNADVEGHSHGAEGSLPVLGVRLDVSGASWPPVSFRPSPAGDLAFAADAYMVSGPILNPIAAKVRTRV